MLKYSVYFFAICYKKGKFVVVKLLLNGSHQQEDGMLPQNK